MLENPAFFVSFRWKKGDEKKAEQKKVNKWRLNSMEYSRPPHLLSRLLKSRRLIYMTRLDILLITDNNLHRCLLYTYSIDIWPAGPQLKTAWNESLYSSLRKRVNLVLLCLTLARTTVYTCRPFCTASSECCMLSILRQCLQAYWFSKAWKLEYNWLSTK